MGASVGNPYLAVPLSFLLHFMGDLVPHWDFYSHTKREERLVGWRPVAVMGDLVCGVAVGLISTLYCLWVIQNSVLALNVFLCGIASVLPDALEAPHIFLKSEPKILQFVTSIQKKMQFQAPLPWGILTQFIVIGFSLFIFLTSLQSY